VIRFSPFFFASNAADRGPGKYRLLIESVRFADAHGFEAVWVPERHFHAFGGVYPNPAVVASALAVLTERIRIRAGSVVLPLHHPVRVAEDWAVVDNLSGGRVDISFARGWNPNDFVIAPDDYAGRTEKLFEGMATVRHLWRGGSVALRNGIGETVETRIFPLPMQPELSVWLTCSGGSQRFVEAGEHGLHVLTNMILQPIDELQAKIRAYREAWHAHGHPSGISRVTVMLHTFVGDDEDRVRRAVRMPFRNYLESSVDLWSGSDRRLQDMTQQQRDEVLDFAFERYYRTSALFGTPASCLALVDRLRAIGVDEIACLIDFGVAEDEVLQGMEHLHRLMVMANQPMPRPSQVDGLSADEKTALLKRMLLRRAAAED
jgi:natural product biosynthesis luciferase-like monooxygenase protein